jgi:hypothetical protein
MNPAYISYPDGIKRRGEKVKLEVLHGLIKLKARGQINPDCLSSQLSGAICNYRFGGNPVHIRDR